MKNLAKNLLVTSLILSICSNCNDDLNNDISPVKFILRTLNIEGFPSTDFKEGENIVFSFLIINNSNNQITYFQSINQEDFLKVTKINIQSGEKPVERFVIGKPFKTMFCNYINGIIINVYDTLKLEIPWITDSSINYPHFCLLEDNKPLEIGNYETSFTSSFDFMVNDKALEINNFTFKTQFNIIRNYTPSDGYSRPTGWY